MSIAFIYVIFIQIIQFSVGNYEYITVLNINPISNSNEKFQCYTPSTFSGYSLSYGRSYRIDESDDLSESFSWFQDLNQAHKYVTNTNWNMGVYFCKILINGKTTVVQTTKIRSDAEITPSNWKTTLTVNVGDDVTISFNGESEWDVNWRKNDTLINDDATKEKHMTFNPVNTNDAGIYEVHRLGRRSERRHSFINLIVRACPRHKWGPPECRNDCEYCYNGGVCDDVTGICICAPGFKGPTCVSECGGNTFGWDCENCCTGHDVTNACMNYQFCLPNPYGCSCVTGFKGATCNTECESGKYGADCAQSCHCNQGECDGYTGRCTDSEDQSCAHPWNGTNCQECKQPYYGESCELECTKPCKCHRITGKCIEESCYSDEWLKPHCEIGIINTTFSSANNGHQTTVYCTIYNGGTEVVQPLVMVITKDGTENIASTSSTSSGNNVMMFLFLVTSELYSTYKCVLVQGSTVAQMDIISEIFPLPSYNGYMKKVTTSSSSITIEWTAWNNKTDDGNGPIVGYYLYYKMSNADSWVNKQYQESLSGTVTGLMSDTSYTFAVSAVRPGEGGEGPIGKQLTVTALSEKIKDVNYLPVAAIGFGAGIVFTVLIMFIGLIVWKKRAMANDTRNESKDQTNTTEGKEPSVYYNRPNPYEETLEVMGEASKNSEAGYYVNNTKSNSGFVASNDGFSKPTDDGTYCEIRNTHA